MHTVEINTSEVIRDVVVEKVNEVIKSTPGIDTNQVSDGYHTFGELYEHRITLFITLCRNLIDKQRLEEGRVPEIADKNKRWGYAYPVWRTKAHSDGSVWDGWFILGICKSAGKQITYHLPISEWDNCWFAECLEKAPDFDGHTSADVLARIKAL